jgi:hypothetical protein
MVTDSRDISRRELLRLAGAGGGALGLAALLTACGGDRPAGGSPTARAGSLQALQAGAQQLSLLGAQSELATGRSLYTFGLATSEQQLVTRGAPRVYLARDDSTTALGPFPTRWYQLDAYRATGDRSPRSPLTGFYGAEVEVPAAGNWLVAATLDLGGTRAAGQGAIRVVDGGHAAVGSRAKPTRTPVATDRAGRERICTREPACPLHAVSLDRALRAGRPTVVTFATPLLCASRMCGPVVDEQMAVADRVGGKASFVHVEIYPTRQPDKPAAPFLAWGFQTEPWLVVADRRGVITARYEGPVTAAQVDAALRPLL